ncbi:EF-hand domain-containing protein [Sphingomonas sp.]|uniref:EF-hand domain-containing protein n=1 Tax=Sphingomonas sp. TaxID=28214 RepID=UPI0035C7C9C1
MIGSVMLALALQVAAQEGGDVVVRAPLPGTPQTPATMVVEPAAMLIATFDTNGDGLVDRTELIEGVRHTFEAIDTARTGQLRYIAFADWAERWLGDRNALPSPFEVDRDQDDQVSLDELQDHFSRLFARYDRNGDRQISRAELLTYRTAPIDAKGPTAGRPPVKPPAPPAKKRRSR